MRVKLLNDGGYNNLSACVGKVFNAERDDDGDDAVILITDLESQGGKVTTESTECARRDADIDDKDLLFIEGCEVEIIEE